MYRSMRGEWIIIIIGSYKCRIIDDDKSLIVVLLVVFWKDVSNKTLHYITLHFCLGGKQ